MLPALMLLKNILQKYQPTADNPHSSNTAPNTRETADNVPRPILREATARRGSLSEAERKEDISPKTRHSSAKQ